jgi:hypothetical protein
MSPSRNIGTDKCFRIFIPAFVLVLVLVLVLELAGSRTRTRTRTRTIRGGSRFHGINIQRSTLNFQRNGTGKAQMSVERFGLAAAPEICNRQEIAASGTQPMINPAVYDQPA